MSAASASKSPSFDIAIFFILNFFQTHISISICNGLESTAQCTETEIKFTSPNTGSDGEQVCKQTYPVGCLTREPLYEPGKVQEPLRTAPILLNIFMFFSNVSSLSPL